MLTNEYIYPAWWLIRAITLMLPLPLTNKFRFYSIFLLATTPLSYSINYLSSFGYFLFYESCFVFLLVEITYLSSLSHKYITFLFILNTIGPFSKFVFVAIHQVDIPLLTRIPSIFHIIAHENTTFLVAVAYPFLFFWFRIYEKYKSNSQ